jgi:hypothetical protein
MGLEELQASDELLGEGLLLDDFAAKQSNNLEKS